MEKPKLNQPATPNEPQGRDLFQTPNYAVDLLIPFIPKHIDFIWDCACGEGKIVHRMQEKGYHIFASDIRDTLITQLNFLKDLPPEYLEYCDFAIITNPPFSLKNQFYKRCLSYNVPFALLIPADYSGWVIDAVRNDGAEKIIPTRRIDYITPTGLSGAGGHTSNFHSMWLTHGFNLGKSETFVDLSIEDKRNI